MDRPWLPAKGRDEQRLSPTIEPITVRQSGDHAMPMHPCFALSLHSAFAAYNVAFNRKATVVLAGLVLLFNRLANRVLAICPIMSRFVVFRMRCDIRLSPYFCFAFW